MTKKILLANYFGQFWVAIMNLAFIPIYIKYLGMESFGLLGVFAFLQTCLSLLDMGMTPTINREMARFTAGIYSAHFIRTLLRSMEIISLAIISLMIFSIWLSSKWISSNWLKSQELSSGLVEEVIILMGVIVGFRIIEGIFRGALTGLQHQVSVNLVNAIFATLRALGAVGVLILISPSIKAFFIWQVILSGLTLAMFIALTYVNLPKANQTTNFSINTLRSIGSFASGVMGITVLSILITQFDKILLSKLLFLEEYGRYALASLVATTLFMLVAPISTAWGPILSKLHAEDNVSEFKKKYHEGSQLVAVMLGSAASLMIIYSQEILYLWTQNQELANKTSALLSVLLIGNLCNGLLWIPFQAQLAYGLTSFALKINLAIVLFIIPAILFITPKYGPEGAAWIWTFTNLGNLIIGMPLMYKIILKNEIYEWYIKDIIIPLIVSAFVAITTYYIMPFGLNNWMKVFWIFGASIITLIITALSASHIRLNILKILISNE